MTDTTTASKPEGQPVSKQFARAMLVTFDAGLKFMSPDHIELRHRQLQECIETGFMCDDLKAVYNWTRKDNPRISP